MMIRKKAPTVNGTDLSPDVPVLGGSALWGWEPALQAKRECYWQDSDRRQIFSPAAPRIRGAFGPAKYAFPPSMAVTSWLPQSNCRKAVPLVTALVFAVVIAAMAGHASAIVVRHDVPAEQYEIAGAPGFLVDLPDDGHGVLIHPQWILTVAHAIFHDYRDCEVQVAAQGHRIAEVILHPDYSEPDKRLFEGDSEPLGRFLQGRSDIALIKLAEPVADISPIALFTGSDEAGLEIQIIGRGATGNGQVGEITETKQRKILRHGQNRIATAEGNWITYTFDKPPLALPLEGITGSGDSGGPTIVTVNGQQLLVGLASWQGWDGDLAEFKPGLYGAREYQVRISSYAQWINEVINGR